MNLEKQKKHKAELSRRQKLARRFLPVAILAGGASVLGAEMLTTDNEPSHEAHAEVTVPAFASAEFNGSEGDWGHGTAENIILYALGEGASKAFAAVQLEGEAPKTPDDVVKAVENLPVYDQANEALEMAGYNEIVPDDGDKLTIEIAVTADSSGDVSYEVVDAVIEDIKNNG
ncbi:MAG: hypothetical protein V4678_01920 [Patescibacteria group bacterium]